VESLGIRASRLFFCKLRTSEREQIRKHRNDLISWRLQEEASGDHCIGTQAIGDRIAPKFAIAAQVAPLGFGVRRGSANRGKRANKAP